MEAKTQLPPREVCGELDKYKREREVAASKAKKVHSRLEK